MAFSEETIKAAFERSNGKCECGMRHGMFLGSDAPHILPNQCPITFEYNEKGDKWHAHHIKAAKDGGSDELSNCRILCLECHYLTHSYGRPKEN